MRIKILEHTTNPIETVYRAFKICYAKGATTNIKILMKDGKVDYKKMIAFIEKWGGLGHESPYEHVSITFAIEGVSRTLSYQKLEQCLVFRLFQLLYLAINVFQLNEFVIICIHEFTVLKL